MNPSSEARIYLADYRRVEQEDWFRTYHTLSFGKFQQSAGEAFHSLLSVNDDTLAAGRTRYYFMSRTETVILLPLVGRLTYRCGAQLNSVDVGQIASFPANQDSVLELTNPYGKELINFLQIRVADASSHSTVDTFDLSCPSNSLIPLLNDVRMNCSFSIGKFDGRRELTVDLKLRRLFAFVIEGAFELEGRLVQSRDGLAVWNTSHAEIEALSSNAIILIAEPV